MRKSNQIREETYYEVAIYRGSDIYDFLGRYRSLAEAERDGKAQSLNPVNTQVSIAKETHDLETDETTREWTRFYRNGKLVNTEKY